MQEGAWLPKGQPPRASCPPFRRGVSFSGNFPVEAPPLSPWKQAPGAACGREGRGRAGRGRGQRAPSRSGRWGPALARSARPPSPRVRSGGGGGERGAVWLSHPLVIRRKVALGPSPASCFLPPALLVSWSRAGRSRAETCEVSGEEPASLPRGTRHPGRRRVHVLRTGREQTFWIVPGHLSGQPSTARGGGARPGGQVRVRGTLLCEWHLRDSFSSGG